MVSKRFCDVCGAELPAYEGLHSATGTFHFGEKSYDLCRYCGKRLGRFLVELKKEYTEMGMLKKKLADMKEQRKLTDSL